MESSQRGISHGVRSSGRAHAVRGLGMDGVTVGDLFTDVLVAAFKKPAASTHTGDSRKSNGAQSVEEGMSFRRRRMISHRRAVVLVMTGVAILTTVVSVMVPQRAQSASSGVEVSSSVVQPGDTWWSYAESLTPQGGDVSVTVDRLMALNHDEDPTLTPGEKIVLPVDAESW
ncbi:LysM peptidoglycan-binding domain-containing protein [uncultured Bifidobacterium sp.]|uniref:LysM peptidoglycan-binding domain-containing protein n=1 Tax=uncultured Bifidobacterium sp. TaxID=165187 RepID=UPI002636DA99|nr:LysM peptidoglycan-binding domain-containing protein [uncultured Bifidobacterium sp.]